MPGFSVPASQPEGTKPAPAIPNRAGNPAQWLPRFARVVDMGGKHCSSTNSCPFAPGAFETKPFGCSPRSRRPASEDTSRSSNRSLRACSDKTLIPGQTEPAVCVRIPGTGQLAVIHPWHLRSSLRLRLRLRSPSQNSVSEGNQLWAGYKTGDHAFRYTYHFHCYFNAIQT